MLFFPFLCFFKNFLARALQFKIQYITINTKFKNKIKFICIKEINKEQASNNLGKSMYLLGKDLLNYCFFKNNQKNKKTYPNIPKKDDKKLVIKNFEYKIPIAISYYYNEEKNDFVETYTDQNLTYFIRSKLSNIDKFIDNCIQNNINEKIIIPYRNENNKGNLNFIINLFWSHCKIGNNFKYFYDKGFFNNLSYSLTWRYIFQN